MTTVNRRLQLIVDAVEALKGEPSVNDRECSRLDTRSTTVLLAMFDATRLARLLTSKLPIFNRPEWLFSPQDCQNGRLEPAPIQQMGDRVHQCNERHFLDAQACGSFSGPSVLETEPRP